MSTALTAAVEYGEGVKAPRTSASPKKDRYSARPTRPVENRRNQRCPCVPRGGGVHRGHSAVEPAAMECQLPAGSRVVPKPTMGEPLRVLSHVWPARFRRPLLLLPLSRRWLTRSPS